MRTFARKTKKRSCYKKYAGLIKKQGEIINSSVQAVEIDEQWSFVGLKAIPFSTLRDGFSRFNAKTIECVLLTLISSLSFVEVPELAMLGKIFLVDSSICNLSINADWADFKKNKKAVKLHLIWNLNQMIFDTLVRRSAYFVIRIRKNIGYEVLYQVA